MCLAMRPAIWKFNSTQIMKEARAASLLDLLFVSREGLVGVVKVGDCLGQSNHEMVEFSVLGEFTDY